MGKMVRPSPEILKLPLVVRAEMAIKVAFDKVIEEHVGEGRPVCVWRDGKVIEVLPEELRTYPSHPH